jgi:peptidoglycan/LPS O-acetylase OafA/YrhL
VGVILLYQAGLTSFTLDQIARAAALNVFYIPYVNEGYIQFFNVRVHDMLFPLDNPAWSLFFGIVANVLYAVCLRTWRNSPVALMLLSAVGVCIATIYLGAAPGFSTRTFIGGLPRVLFSFFAGVVVFQFHGRTSGLGRISGWIIVVAILALTAVPRFGSGHRYYWLAAVIATVPLLVAMGSWVQVREGSFWQRLCNYSGRISYPLFCLHYPLLVLFSLLPRDDSHMELLSLTFLDFLGLSVAYFCTTLVVAHYTMTLVEEPLRAWLGSLRNRLALQRGGPS